MATNKIILLFINILAIRNVISFNDSRCDEFYRLPNGCHLESYYCYLKEETNLCYFYVCDQIDADFVFDENKTKLIQNCSSSNHEIKEAINDVYFRLAKPSILDSSFNLVKNQLLLTETFEDFTFIITFLEMASDQTNKITFSHIKGFDETDFLRKKDTFIYSLRLEFYYSKLDFYQNHRLIKSLDELKNSHQFKFDSSIYNPNNLNDARFHYSDYKSEICPFIFYYLKIDRLRFYGVQNTFYRRNFPRFMSPDKYNISFKYSDLLVVDFFDMENIEVNSILLDKTVFNSIYSLRLFGDVKSIESGLFSNNSFRSLRYIHLDSSSFRKLINLGGIDWIRDLNSNVNVDLNTSNHNESYYFTLKFRCFSLFLYTYNEHGSITSLSLDTYSVFPDEDFCLYVKYPFHQVVLLYSNVFSTLNYSCTYAWLIQHHEVLFGMCNDYFYSIFSILIYNNHIKYKLNATINKCDFPQR